AARIPLLCFDAVAEQSGKTIRAYGALMETNPNPLLEEWPDVHGLPPFAAISPQHFRGAFDHVLPEIRAQIQAIASNTASATFDNTVLAVERCSARLTKYANVLFNLTRAHSNSLLQDVEYEVAPKIAKLRTQILTNETLFFKINELHRDPTRHCRSQEESRVLALLHRKFVRAGVRVASSSKLRLTQISGRLAELGVRFNQNILTDENAFI